MSILDQQSHNLQFPIFESFVLQYFLNGNDFPSFVDRGLEDDAEGSVANDSFGGVRDCFAAAAGGSGCGSGGSSSGSSCSIVVVGIARVVDMIDGRRGDGILVVSSAHCLLLLWR
jgi:hypothetical protein